MNVISVNPRECCRWNYADRSLFEFGNIAELADDISRNGQIEPVLIRKLLPSTSSIYKYEIIAGSRRWKACLDFDLMLKAIVVQSSDEEAAIIQIKENQALPICDYSKGMYYAKIIEELNISQDKLAKNINCSRTKLQNYLTFQKVPHSIWDAVGNLSKISARTAATIYTLSLRGTEVISILISLADDIRKGIGSTRLENIVNQQLLDQVPNSSHEIRLSLPSGATIATWKNSNLKFDKNVSIDQDKFFKYIVKFFA